MLTMTAQDVLALDRLKRVVKPGQWFEPYEHGVLWPMFQRPGWRLDRLVTLGKVRRRLLEGTENFTYAAHGFGMEYTLVQETAK